MVIRGKGATQVEIPMVATGKETDRHKGEKLGLRTDMTGQPPHSLFTITKTSSTTVIF